MEDMDAGGGLAPVELMASDEKAKGPVDDALLLVGWCEADRVVVPAKSAISLGGSWFVDGKLVSHYGTLRRPLAQIGFLLFFTFLIR